MPAATAAHVLAAAGSMSTSETIDAGDTLAHMWAKALPAFPSHVTLSGASLTAGVEWTLGVSCAVVAASAGPSIS